MPTAWLRRHWTPRRIMAVMVAVFWGDMARQPVAYSANMFIVLRGIAPMRWWGITLLVAAVIMFATRTVWPVVLMGGILCTWTVGLLAAVVSGDSEAPASSVFVVGYVLLLWWGLSRDAPGIW